MFLERGFEFTHETVRGWEARFAPPIAEQLRMKRRGHVGVSWHVDETYVKVQGKWVYWLLGTSLRKKPLSSRIEYAFTGCSWMCKEDTL
jgi:transposase-like protein